MIKTSLGNKVGLYMFYNQIYLQLAVDNLIGNFLAINLSLVSET